MEKWAHFPAGLKVVVVDDDALCLKVVGQMLTQCQYQVTTCSSASQALELLRNKTQKYDLVLSDVYMPDMDGFKLLEIIGLEIEVPVIMMSSDGDTNVVLNGVLHGAVDFLIKPVRLEELRNVWQHVLRRRRELLKDDAEEAKAEVQDVESKPEAPTGRKKEARDRDGQGDMVVHISAKKPRIKWTAHMHQQFVSAVNELGIEKAVPKKILEKMNVEGLTRENVASHLQKYRLYLKRVQTTLNQGDSNQKPAGGNAAHASSSAPAAGGPVAGPASWTGTAGDSAAKAAATAAIRPPLGMGPAIGGLPGVVPGMVGVPGMPGLPGLPGVAGLPPTLPGLPALSLNPAAVAAAAAGMPSFQAGWGAIPGMPLVGGVPAGTPVQAAPMPGAPRPAAPDVAAASSGTAAVPVASASGASALGVVGSPALVEGALEPAFSDYMKLDTEPLPDDGRQTLVEDAAGLDGLLVDADLASLDGALDEIGHIGGGGDKAAAGGGAQGSSSTTVPGAGWLGSGAEGVDDGQSMDELLDFFMATQDEGPL